jgi:hypothetical protein
MLTRYDHQRGRVVIHKGFCRHGADEIVSGSRDNLIIWCTNEEYQSSASYHSLVSEQSDAKESSEPDVECVSYTWDRDYIMFKTSFPPNIRPMNTVQRAMYPTKGSEYDSMASPDEIQVRLQAAETIFTKL